MKSKEIANYLAKLVQLPNKAPYDYVPYIVGTRTNAVYTSVQHDPKKIKLLRTIGAIGTKVKESQTIMSNDDLVKEFAAMQSIDIYLSRLYTSKVKQVLQETFKNFAYDFPSDLMRKPLVTPGSSYPQRIAPSGVKYEWETSDYVSTLEDLAYYGDDRLKPGFDQYKVKSELSVVDGKIVVVPKNYKRGRMITITSRDFIERQSPLNERLRSYVTNISRVSNHITQFTDQTVQHGLLKAGYATIDLSSASDRVYVKLIEIVWPEILEVVDLPKVVRYEISNSRHRDIELTCVGTQGFPLTFTLMSIVIGAIVSAVKRQMGVFKPSANYGDDIIVPEEIYEETICALHSLGMKVNTAKSFRSSEGFLESCGKDVMFIGKNAYDITPIHLRQVNDIGLINFVTQLAQNNLIDLEESLKILNKFCDKFYAFENSYQYTEFHFPFGEFKHKGFKVKYRRNNDYQTVEVAVPSLSTEKRKLRTLSSIGSKFVYSVLEYIKLVNQPKLNDSELTTLFEFRAHHLYDVYKYISDPLEGMLIDPTSDYTHEILEKYRISIQTLAQLIIVVNRMELYRFSSKLDVWRPVQQSAKRAKHDSLIKDGYIKPPKGELPIHMYRILQTTKWVPMPMTHSVLAKEKEDEKLVDFSL